MKAALIALALLATPASATSILTSDTTSIVAGQSITFNIFLTPNEGQEFIGFAPAEFSSGDGQTLYNVFIAPPSFGGNVTFTYLTAGDYTAEAWVPVVFYVLMGSQRVAINHGVYSASENITVSVPEPATWALLLFGFAFFGIKGIWPGASHG